MLLAVPTGFGIALFDELCPPLLAPDRGRVELLAAVPSIIFGIWGCSCSRRCCNGMCSPG